MKVITTITLDPEIKQKSFEILKEMDKTLSEFIEEKLKQLIKENADTRTT